MNSTLIEDLKYATVSMLAVYPTYVYIDRTISPEYPPLVLEAISAGLYILAFILDSHSTELVLKDPQTKDLVSDFNFTLPEVPETKDLYSPKQLAISLAFMSFGILNPAFGIAMGSAKLATALNNYKQYFSFKKENNKN